MYGMNTKIPSRDYFACMRSIKSTGAFWTHVRTNLGRKAAYAMIAKHYDGSAKIHDFRDDTQMLLCDRQGLDQGSEGVLRRGHPLSGYSEMAVYY